MNPYSLVPSNGDTLHGNASLGSRYPRLLSEVSTGSPRTRQLALRWLKECEEGHQVSCWGNYQATPPRKHAPLPHRILHIGTESSSQIRLSEYEECDAPYMCLSYCWGQQEFIQTTRDTKEKFKGEILMQDLPLVFRQFIQLARDFGITYVWIDALCIIQDDEDDWKAEAKSMAQIYSNSWLTIAATAAKGPHEDMFRNRKMRTVELTKGAIRSQRTCHFPNNPNDDREAVFPLLKRGWVCQERLLSPKVLHFGPDEIIWDCSQEHRCECGQSSHFIDEVNKSDFFKHSGQSVTLSKKEMAMFWRNIVIQYTNLALTKPDDRLYALHGILQTIGGARQRTHDNDAYLVGLWKQSLAFDLLWNAPSPAPGNMGGRTPAQLERAPSWSWASLDCPIRWPPSFYDFPTDEVKKECQIILGPDWTVGSLESKPVGQVEIKLKAKSLEPGNRLDKDTITFHCDNDSCPSIEEVYICFIASGHWLHTLCEYWALALKPSGQFFTRVGIVSFKKYDKGLPWVERTFAIR